MRIAYIIITLMLMSCTNKPPYPEPTIRGNDIIITTPELKENIPQFYTVRLKNKRYDFFVLSQNHEISSYIDACFKCGPKKMGFEVNGSRIRCRACGESFPVSKLNGIGSCYPIVLKGSLMGEQYLIDIQTLIKKTLHPL